MLQNAGASTGSSIVGYDAGPGDGHQGGSRESGIGWRNDHDGDIIVALVAVEE